jgi:hypothetical protein
VDIATKWTLRRSGHCDEVVLRQHIEKKEILYSRAADIRFKDNDFSCLSYIFAVMFIGQSLRVCPHLKKTVLKQIRRSLEGETASKLATRNH